MPLDDTLGKITVPSAGTFKQVITTDLWVESYMVEPWFENTGKTWVGKSTATKDGVGIHAVLPVPHTNVISSFNRKGKLSRSFNLKDLYIGVDTDGESAIVSYNLA